ncbi:MAG: hypothetical protein MI867_02925 [Pseudomonadales bacterium]|nr:hypothetical protein [Pseudomonadales bacterium]
MSREQVKAAFLSLSLCAFIAGCDGGGSSGSPNAAPEDETPRELDDIPGDGDVIALGLWVADVSADGEEYAAAMPIKVIDAVEDGIELQKCGELPQLYQNIDDSYLLDDLIGVESLAVGNYETVTLNKNHSDLSDVEITQASFVTDLADPIRPGFQQGSVSLSGALPSLLLEDREICAFKVAAPGLDGVVRERDEVRIFIYQGDFIIQVAVSSLYRLPKDYISEEPEELTIMVGAQGMALLGDESGPFIPTEGTVHVVENNEHRFAATFQVNEWVGFEEQALDTQIHIDITFL